MIRVSLLLAILGALLPPAPAAAFRYVSVGSPVPILTFLDLEGRRVSVPRAGQPAVIIFWRPDQKLSDEALGDLAELVQRLGPNRVDVVAIAEADADGRQSRARSQKFRLRFLLDRAALAGEAYGIIVYPSTAVVGPDGRLVYYLPIRNPQYRALIESHVLRARGEISDHELMTRLSHTGGANGGAELDRAQAAYKGGVMLARDKRYEEAQARLVEALSLAPDLAEAHLQLGYVKLELGAPAQALEEFGLVLKTTPTSPRARLGAGIARLRLGEVEEAIRLLEEAVILNPDPVRAHYELARAYEARGDAALAIERYRWAYLKLLQGRK